MEFLYIAIGAALVALYIFVRTYRNARATGAERIDAAKYAAKVVYKGGQGLPQDGKVGKEVAGGVPFRPW